VGEGGRHGWFDLAARPAFFPALSLGLGAWLSGTTGRLPSVFLLFAGLALLVSAAVFSRRVGAHLCLLVGFGVTGHALGTLQARTSVPAAVLERPRVEVEGIVEEVVPYDASTRLTLAVSRAAEDPAHFEAHTYARGAPLLRPGQRILARAALRPLEAPSNPGQPDFRGALRRRGLLFSGAVDAGQWTALSPASPWQLWLAGAQASLAERVRTLAPSPEAGALYLTLAAGLRAELGEDLEDRFAASGLAHVLSISGLHVAALALMLLKVLRWTVARLWPGARRTDARRLAGPLAVPWVWAYVVFTGSQPPAVRSAVMATVLFVGMALWRRPDSLNSLSIAALAIVAMDPASVADLSLQLSFMAVLSLVLVSPAVRGAIPIQKPHRERPGPWQHRWGRIREEALQTLSASAAVTATGLPLIASTFHRLSLAGLISNIVCLPLCGILTALSAGGAALHLAAPAVATTVLWAGSWAAQVLIWLVDGFAMLPGAAVAVPALSGATAVAFEVGLFCFALARRRARWLGLIAPLALGSAWIVPRIAPGPPLRVAFLSVGHGDAIVVSSAGHHALIDGGGTPGGADTGKRYVLPYLRERGIRSLDLAVLTHPHPDHALGLVSTLGVLRPAHLWIGRGSIAPWASEAPTLTGQVASAAGVGPEEVWAGHPAFALGAATLEVLGPPAHSSLAETTNDRSVVLRLSYRDVSFLLTGDIEAAGEEALAPTPATVVKAPHHGSRTSSSESFVGATRPRYVVFCVGRANRFHFPAAEVEARYQAVGARCLRTDLDGAVEISTDGEQVDVQTFLQRD
jgi:competence protein ComEC